MKLNKDSNYNDLARVVDASQGVGVFSMGLLRDVHKAGKLGSTVVFNISNRLKEMGFGHSPTELPRGQGELVIIYRMGSRIAQIVEAVTSISEGSDDVLRGCVGESNADTETVRRIRELVCD